MKKWLKRKIRRWLNDDSIEIACEPPIVRGNSGVDIDGISFNVMSASGGVIVQTRQYNSKIDRHTYSTHIIPDGEPVAERIGHIVSLEILKNS
jgi:hypothetical protein